MAFPTTLLTNDMDYLLGEWPTTCTIGTSAVTGIVTGYNITETLEIGGDEVELSHSAIFAVSDYPGTPTIGSMIETPDGHLRIVDFERSPDRVHFEVRLTTQY